MQDAYIGSWARESHVPPEMLESVRTLNRQFLDLVCGEAGAFYRAGQGPQELCAWIAPLTAAQKTAAANCPYALFDLRFHDDRHWQTRLRGGSPWCVSEDARAQPGAREFARVALFFAWHVAATARLAPLLLLGMCEETAAAFRNTTIDCLPSLAVTEAVHLTARWNGCAPYWTALTGAASRPNSARLRRIQLYGLQLAAAARLG